MKGLIPSILGLLLAAQLIAQPTFSVADTAVSGETSVCISINTLDFTDLTSAQFTLNWDSTLLEFDSIANLGIPGLSLSDFNLDSTTHGLLAMSWGDSLQTQGTSLPDSTTLFQVCFSFSPFCSTTNLYFSDDLLPVYVTRETVGTINIGAFLEEGILAHNENPAELTNLTTLDVSCFGNSNGAIEFTLAGGGGPPYEIRIEIFIYNSDDGTFSLNNVPAGAYEVIFSGANGCPDSFTIEIQEPDPLEIQLVEIIPESCPGNEDGSIEIVITGGTGPYTYLWDYGNSTPNAQGLAAGFYSLTVTDELGCTITGGPYEVETGLIVESPGDTTVCIDQSFTLEVLAPNAQLYAWSIAGSGQMSCTDCPNPVISELYEDHTFSVTVTGPNDCIEVEEIFVYVRHYLDFWLLPFSNSPVCEGDTLEFYSNIWDGQLYQWTGPNGFVSNVSDPIISNVQIESSGTYLLEAVDDIGCEISAEAEVEIFNPLNLTEILTHASCEVLCDGAIELDISGGTPPYSINMMGNPVPGGVLSDLCPGAYSFFIQDAEGCSLNHTSWIEGGDCIEIITDSIIVNQTGTWCSILSAVAGPLGYEFTGFSCDPASDVVDYDIDFNALCIAYTGLEVSTDTLCVELCLQTGSPCYTAELHISVIEDQVWPGDMDTTGLANNHDLLMLGLAIDSSGFTRSGATLDWTGQEAMTWPQQTPLSRINYKHIDTDGNGIIEINDTLALSQNWGLEHDFRGFEPPQQFRPNPDGVPFYIEPDTLIEGATFALPLILGTEDFLAQQVYGLAFTIQFDPEIIKPGVRLQLTESWLGTPEDLVIMQREYHEAGRLEVGITRLDGVNRAGQGEIGVFIISLEDDILFIIPNEEEIMDTRFEIVDFKIISFGEVELEVDNTPKEAEIISGLNNPAINHLIDVFPNPAKNKLYIRSEHLELEAIELYNTRGQLMQVVKPDSKSIDLNICRFPSGLYWVKTTTPEGIAVKKVMLITDN